MVGRAPLPTGGPTRAGAFGLRLLGGVGCSSCRRASRNSQGTGRPRAQIGWHRCALSGWVASYAFGARIVPFWAPSLAGGIRGLGSRARTPHAILHRCSSSPFLRKPSDRGAYPRHLCGSGGGGLVSPHTLSTWTMTMLLPLPPSKWLWLWPIGYSPWPMAVPGHKGPNMTKKGFYPRGVRALPY